MRTASPFFWGIALLCSRSVLLSKAAYSTAYPNYNLNTTYHSRPDLLAPKFLLSVNDEAFISPGYILLTPVTQTLGSSLSTGFGGLEFNSSLGTPQEQLAALFLQTIQNGPYLYDMTGELVYSGYGSTGGLNSENLKLAQYKGEPHLTFVNGDDQRPYSGSRAKGVILDRSYGVVATVNAGLGRTSNDVHEFTVLEDGTAIFTIYQPAQYDLTPYGGNQSVGWIVESIFQRVDIGTGHVLFEWRSSEHTTPADSYLPLDAESGVGTSAANPYDYFHINSIQLDSRGNYIISSRHLSTVFYLSGVDGSVLWRLNGKNSDFSLINFNASFAFQHNARIRSQNDTNMEISIFDNGSNGPITFSSASAGMIILLDLDSKTATLQKQFSLPNGGVLSTSQGSMQTLSGRLATNGTTSFSIDGNVFIGWGNLPYVSEHRADGTPVLIGQFGAVNEALASSYRAFKIGVDDWHASPESTPALWTYANSTTGPTSFYVSWNGATEVSKWRFYSADVAGNATNTLNSTLIPTHGGTLLGETCKSGFETTFEASVFYAAGFAEGLDDHGNVLGVSPIKKTYVPGSSGHHANAARNWGYI